MVISTQVVEVSLNIDLDVLYSDPAPLEALVQRFGRINRGRRLKIASVNVFKEPSDGQRVYLSSLVQEALNLLIKYADGRVLEENAVQMWLDEIYTGTILEEWENEYQKAAKEFREAFINNLRPFSSNYSLTEAFARLFDGMEILPACLEQDYRDMYKQDSIAASQYLVPVSMSQWHRMKHNKQVLPKPDMWPPVVDVLYCPEVGL